MPPVPVLAGSISVSASIIVLGLNVWKTFYIFKADREIRAVARISKKLAYNGNTPIL